MSLLSLGTCNVLSTENIKILRSSGIRTVVDFLGYNPEDITRKTSLSIKVVVMIRKALLAQHASLPVRGLALYTRVSQSMTILSTGITSIDKLLDGGLYSTELTECVGSPATGKTQLCHAVAAKTSLISKHSVLYICTGGDFSCKRLRDFLRVNCTSQKAISDALRQVRCVRAFDVFQLLDIIQNLPALIHEDDVFHSNLKLVIVDSVAAVISPVIGGKQIEGHGLMMQIARVLKEMVVEENVAVLVTNRMVQGEKNTRKPALGATWLHVPHTRILLSADKVESSSSVSIIRKAKIIKSVRQPLNITAKFTISESVVTG